MTRILVFICLTLASSSLLYANKADEIRKADSLLLERGEVSFMFPHPGKAKLAELSNNISIDIVSKDTLIGYANTGQFGKFLEHDIDFKVVSPYTLMAAKPLKYPTIPFPDNYFPDHQAYVQLLGHLSEEYPSLCTMVIIGESTSGLPVFALKLSDHPDVDQDETEIFLTSSIHGDETTGFVCMIYLIDFLLEQYSGNELVKSVLDQTEIWINPLANPDGMYFLNGDSVYQPKRYNANNVDLNRNFPNPLAGDHPDGVEWQKETLDMMNFMQNRQFSLSANFHSGAEVLNYPWDTWSRAHADEKWFEYICRQYADTVHQYSEDGYLDPSWSDNGIVKGYDWYKVLGSRQDYVCYFLHGREITVELSNIKNPSMNTINRIWEYNKKSLLLFLHQATYGISGIISDHITNEPVRAKIEIVGHDQDHSYVYSDTNTGRFVRFLYPGTYNILVSSMDYESLQKNNIILQHNTQYEVNFELKPDLKNYQEMNLRETNICIFPNPADDFLIIDFKAMEIDELTIDFYSIQGTFIASYPCQAIHKSYNTKTIDVSGFEPGVYFCIIKLNRKLIHKKILIL